MTEQELAAIRERCELRRPTWNEARALLTEVDRLREIERKAQEQSAYIQTHGLTEIEVAALRAENERLSAALAEIVQINEDDPTMRRIEQIIAQSA